MKTPKDTKMKGQKTETGHVGFAKPKGSFNSPSDNKLGAKTSTGIPGMNKPMMRGSGKGHSRKP